MSLNSSSPTNIADVFTMQVPISSKNLYSGFTSPSIQNCKCLELMRPQRPIEFFN